MYFKNNYKVRDENEQLYLYGFGAREKPERRLGESPKGE